MLNFIYTITIQINIVLKSKKEALFLEKGSEAKTQGGQKQNKR